MPHYYLVHNHKSSTSQKITFEDYSPFIETFTDHDSNCFGIAFKDLQANFQRRVIEAIGKTLFFHITYKKMAIWVRAERPSLDDEFIINIFTPKKPIGIYSIEMPATVRAKNANYHDGCKHYAICCPNQPVSGALAFSINGDTLRERFIRVWRRSDDLGWQGMLGDPEEIYPEENSPEEIYPEEISPASICCRGYS